jgi:HD-GYP domain-containing protein (c-di-GMP phosphodiesterase class II)
MIADVYDALRSERPYKKPFSHDQTLDIIITGDGRTKPEDFDPVILELFSDLQQNINQIYSEISNSAFSLQSFLKMKE